MQVIRNYQKSKWNYVNWSINTFSAFKGYVMHLMSRERENLGQWKNTHIYNQLHHKALACRRESGNLLQSMYRMFYTARSHSRKQYLLHYIRLYAFISLYYTVLQLLLYWLHRKQFHLPSNIEKSSGTWTILSELYWICISLPMKFNDLFRKIQLTLGRSSYCVTIILVLYLTCTFWVRAWIYVFTYKKKHA